jgi:hypothetical protein
MSFMAATQTVGWIRSHGRKATAFALFALVLLTALAFASSSKAAVESPAPPSVWSDKADYAPGELVTLSGASWAPGEPVHIRVNDDAGQTWSRDVDVTAAQDGTFTDQFNLPDWFVAQYSVTATGASSGTATWSFTDGNAASVSGTVTDSITATAISNATVTCTSGCNNSPAASTTTNASGNYVFDTSTTKLSFSGTGPATLTLTVSKTGYTSGTITFTVNNNGDTLTGKNVALTPACTAASVTTNPTNQTVTYGNNATFTAAGSGNPAPTVQWQVDSGSGFTNLAGQTSTTLSLTKPTVSMSGNEYRAVFTNTCGGTQTATTSAATLTVNPKSITIAPASGQNKVYGSADPALTYTSSPALESGDSFTGSLGRAAGENVGNYAINLGTLSAGNNYSLSLSGIVNFTITKKDATWTTNDNSKTYGSSDPSPLTTGSGSGFLAADGVSASYSRAAGETVAGGPYHITATLSPAGVLDNYNITNAGASFSIEKRPITVKATNISRVYGDSTPAFSLALSSGSFAYSDGFADLGTPSFGFDNPGDGVNVGTYRINVSGLSNSNYDISYATGTNRGLLTITPAELKVNADDKAKTYGNADPDPSSSLSGFKLGDTAAVVSGAADCSTGAHSENAGTYNDVYSCLPGTLSAANYTFAAGSKGKLTINPRPITVAADAKTKIFGNPDPPLTYHLTSGSLVAGDSFSGALTRVAGEAVGSYAIQKNTLTAGSNYDLTYVGANLTITAWNALGYGFYAPVGVANSVFTAAPSAAPSVNPGEYWNTAKGGSTIPLKFNVYAGSVEKTSLSDILGFQASKVSCAGGTGDDAIEFVTSGNTSLRYDGTGGQWIQNWKTPTANSDTCYRAWVTFADGSSIEAFFKLKK